MPAGRRIGIELSLFVALGAFGLAQWSRLVADPPAGRLLLALAIVTAGAGLLALVGTRRARLPFPLITATAIAVGATALAAVVVGLPARLLAPGNWAELTDNVSRGLAGFEDTEVPYDGDDVWLRLTLLLGAPLLLGIAAALGFWPARRRALPRTAALAALVALYGTAVTLDSPGSELLWGIPLLVLAAGWLWVPRLEPRRALVALGAAAAAGVIALPVAARLDSGAPWWDYESWDWFGRDSEVTFEWNHTYGPLEWPQEGTTLLEARSTEVLYWKASVLDRFDGFTWQRASGDDAISAAERAARRVVPGGELAERHPEWLTPAQFEVAALSSGVAIGAGTTTVIDGIDGVTVSTDGTLRLGEGPLEAGDRYSIQAYSPQPDVAELRDAPASYPGWRFARSTLIGLPATVGGPAGDGPASSTAEPGAEAEPPVQGGFAPGRARAMPLWGEEPDAALDAEIMASPYGDMYEVARSLSADAATPYDAVTAIEDHLRNGYDYSPNVPQHTYPLAAFMFEDGAGYCQQFAGAMALMLRMVGIPSRVVSGFAPGSYDSERRVYEIRDTDAHSWVEAYFRGIGWVTFDPTPASAPAASQTLNAEVSTPDFRGRSSVPEIPGRVQSIEAGAEGGTLGPVGNDPGPWGTIALTLLGVGTAVGAVAGVVFWRRRRALAAGTAVDAQLSELRMALPRLGWAIPAEATLLGLERRFRAARRPAVAGYAAGLRAHRYSAAAPEPPGPAARRAMRRALSGGGLRRRLRALAAIPPGGPKAGGE